MCDTTFRQQIPTDRISQVDERYNDNEGAYQIAHGTDADDQAIRLCNRGFSSWPNYYKTEYTAEEKRYHFYKRIIKKRRQQVEAATVAGNIGLRALRRYHLNMLTEKIRQEYGGGW